MELYNDKTDGITHVNIYSKGKTSLGRMLSNFYEYPIKTTDGDFRSVEGYWYWMSIDDAIIEKERLRELSGFKAKMTGIEILKTTNNGHNSRFDVDFERKILKAIWYKFRRNTHLILPAYKSMPLRHYYVYKDRIIDVTHKYQWMIKTHPHTRDFSHE